MGIKTTSFQGKPLRYFHEGKHLRLNTEDLSHIFGVNVETISPASLPYIPLGLTLTHANQYNPAFGYWLSNSFDGTTDDTKDRVNQSDLKIDNE